MEILRKIGIIKILLRKCSIGSDNENYMDSVIWVRFRDNIWFIGLFAHIPGRRVIF